MHNFILDSRLEADSTFISAFPLCDVRLHHNSAFPWVLLIPRREKIYEIVDLNGADQQALMQEIVLASHVMQRLFQPTKLNIATLGNIVSQLHIHIIARYNHDRAWPDPVWNSGVYSSYDEKKKTEYLSQLKDTFQSMRTNG